jgi:hypothetical protein
MGKNSNKDYDRELRELMEQEKKIKKQMKKLPINCPHTSSSGTINGEIDNANNCRCDRCNTRYNMNPISSQSLDEAVTIVTNAINQIKVFTDNPKEDSATIKLLGETAFNVEDIAELYKGTVIKKSDKKKKKKKNKNCGQSFGSYTDSISLGGGKKKKKKNKW